MAFLNKKEQSLIRLLKANDKLTPEKRKELIADVTYKAHLRQDGYRAPVRELLNVLANHNSEKVLKAIQ
jgi:hypothetical protein